MTAFRPDIPPHVAEVIRRLQPDLKQLIKAAIRAISVDPECGGLLQRELRGPGLHFTWNDPRETLVEAFLTRGDRKLCDVIERAWQLGTKLDAWGDQFRFDAWQQAEWPLEVWPGWLRESVPARAGSAGGMVH